MSNTYVSKHASKIPDRQTLAFDDIMSTDGVTIPKLNTTISIKSVSDCDYFASKRMGTKEQVQSVAGMSAMIIETVGVRAHGIRPWEKTQSEMYMRRQREQERRNQVHMVHKFKREQTGNELKQQKESRQRREEEDARYFEQTRREIDAPVRAITALVHAHSAVEEEDPTW
jgi:hypothetical protein